MHQKLVQSGAEVDTSDIHLYNTLTNYQYIYRSTSYIELAKYTYFKLTDTHTQWRKESRCSQK